MEIGGYRVEKVLIEGQVPINAELYAAVLNDPASRAPVVLFSTMGGLMGSLCQYPLRVSGNLRHALETPPRSRSGP